MNTPLSHYETLGKELGIAARQVADTAALLSEGATVPFIARYRKERTGSLDEVAIQNIRDRLESLNALEKRRQAILDSLAEQGSLVPDLEAAVRGAVNLAELEDIYLPYRPKRRTRATIAREKGLEPLAELVLSRPLATIPLNSFVDPAKGVANPDEALEGAKDIIAEWASEDAKVREALRGLFVRKAFLTSSLIAKKEAEAQKFKDYFKWREPLRSAPSHRVLAALRGQSEGYLTVHAQPESEEAIALLCHIFLERRHDSPAAREALLDSYKRLLQPSLESEAMALAKEQADREAIRVFASNLKELLLAPPLGQKRLLSIDPGFRTGCKMVALDAQGALLASFTVYPELGQERRREAGEALLAACAKHQVEAVAVGNGTGGRETEAFLKELGVAIPIIQVDESGASIYSAGELARQEFPDQDITVRGAVSIGRRLQDPLAELVKLDPKSIGVGQYQHDVDQKALRRSLDDVVISCVNQVGVELNSASAPLLAYVSGLGPKLAAAIVEQRGKRGPFRTRRDLLEVPRLGQKAFEQAAGFLRLRHGSEPLDASAVHPERYALVAAMARGLGRQVAELVGNPELTQSIPLEKYVSEEVGLPTLRDIVAELDKPGRDPRADFVAFSFAEGVRALEDLKPGMRLPGVVTNVTKFGAFVDVGVHQDGLVHISQMADHFVKDPAEVVKVRQQVMVTVLEVDAVRRRVALSLRQPAPDGR